MLRFHYKKIMGDIADALRTRLGTSNRYKVKDIPQQIVDIPKGLEPSGIIDAIIFTGTNVSGSSSMTAGVPFQNIPLSKKPWSSAIIVPDNMIEAINNVNNNKAYTTVYSGLLINNADKDSSQFPKSGVLVTPTSASTNTISRNINFTGGTSYVIMNTDGSIGLCKSTNAILFPKIKYKILFFN